MSTSSTPVTTYSTWNIDPVHSVAEFKVKHMMISNVKGQFAGISGVLKLDEADITRSRVEASIDASSINTRDPQRDAHLKSADFFDVEKFPTLNFRSKSVSRTDGGIWTWRRPDDYGVTRKSPLRWKDRPLPRRILGAILAWVSRPSPRSTERISV